MTTSRRVKSTTHGFPFARILNGAGFCVAPTLWEFVRSLAHRIAGFPAAGRAALKDRVNSISLAQVGDFRRDSDMFLERARDPETQRRTKLAMTRGFQTHDGELALAKMVTDLAE